MSQETEHTMPHTAKRTIRALRMERGWSQRKVSNLLDIAISTLQDWEGNRTEPKLAQMRKVMETFNVSWDEVEWPEKAKKEPVAA